MMWRQSNNQCSGGMAAHPPNPKFPNTKSTGKSLASILFGKKDGILHIDYLPKGPNHQRGVFFVSACKIEAHIEGKKRREFH
jgi:hypothetical protein